MYTTQMNQNPARSSMARDQGFTLIELLVVLTILALLFGFGAKGIGKFIGRGNQGKTSAILAHVENLLEQYRNATGDYPPSSLQQLGVRSPNVLFEGNEALVLGLFQQSYTGNRIDEEYLSQNLDGDRADKNISTFAEPVLLEVLDGWGNPLVYIRHDALEASHEYEFTVAETGSPEPAKVKAVKNTTTGSYYDKEKYQLMSAGEDGVFGNDDDVQSFGN